MKIIMLSFLQPFTLETLNWLLCASFTDDNKRLVLSVLFLHW